MRCRIGTSLGVVWLLASVASASPLPSGLTDGVARVGAFAAGKQGALIVVIEERHDSVVGALQEAVVLERLRREADLSDIALEGYLGLPDAALSGRDESARRVSIENGLRMLESGEISSAEFMQLTQGTTVHPIEAKKDYLQPEGSVAAAPIIVLTTIAMKRFERQAQNGTLDDEMGEKALELERKLGSASDEQKMELIAKFQLSLVDWDPWTREHSPTSGETCDDRPPSITESIEQVKAIRARAKAVGAELPDEVVAVVEEYVRFLEAREAASATMVANTGRIADRRTAPVAMIIGAGHTKRVESLLRAQNRPFVIVTPLALAECDEEGDQSRERYERLVQGLPPEDGFLEKALVAAFPVQIKPRPLTTQSWFQARIQLTEMADDFARRLLDGSAGGSPPTKPPSKGGPAAFDPEEWHRQIADPDHRGELIGSPADWDREQVRIDTTRVTPVIDGPGEDYGVVFPVILKGRSGERNQEIWIAARRPRRRPEGEKKTSSRDVEDRLLDAIERVRTGEKPKKIGAKTARLLSSHQGLQVYAAESKEAAIAAVRTI